MASALLAAKGARGSQLAELMADNGVAPHCVRPMKSNPSTRTICWRNDGRLSLPTNTLFPRVAVFSTSRWLGAGTEENHLRSAMLLISARDSLGGARCCWAW